MERSEVRRSALRGIDRLSHSDDASDRAASGVMAAELLDVEGAGDMCVRLLLDPHDTFVTLSTATALARQESRAAWRSIVLAVGSGADDQTQDWIDTGIERALVVYRRDLDAARAFCEELRLDEQAEVRDGAASVLDFLSQLRPILEPQPRSTPTKNGADS